MLNFITSVFLLISQFVIAFDEYFLWYLAFTALAIVAYLVYRRILRW